MGRQKIRNVAVFCPFTGNVVFFTCSHLLGSFNSFNYRVKKIYILAENWNILELLNPSQRPTSSLHLFVSTTGSLHGNAVMSKYTTGKDFAKSFLWFFTHEVIIFKTFWNLEFMSFVWCCTFKVDLNELGWFRSASCVCLRAVSAVVVSGSDWVS